MKILIYGKNLVESQVESVRLVLNILHQRGHYVCIYKPYLEQIESFLASEAPLASLASYEALRQDPVDTVLTLGGDGTILAAVTLVRDLGIPILGINLGRLGFLASIEEKFIVRAFEMLTAGQYRVEERSMIYLDSNMPLFEDVPFALNDFTILKRDNSSMIIIHTYVNGEFLNSYWADGLIVSTPTGSTGYSLSCGGPIIFPDSNNLIITPVAPHNLSIRPVVLSDNNLISFEVQGRTENFLCTLDSRLAVITQDYRLAVRKCAFNTRLIQLEEMSFMKTMRSKLMWGHDTRKHL